MYRSQYGQLIAIYSEDRSSHKTEAVTLESDQFWDKTGQKSIDAHMPIFMKEPRAGENTCIKLGNLCAVVLGTHHAGIVAIHVATA